jgi:transcription elongation factor Elf1
LFSGEKPYKCRFCTWASISATHLKAHMKNHSNQLPFGCGQCQLGFKLKCDLVKHSKDLHNGVTVLQDGNSNQDFDQNFVVVKEQEEEEEEEEKTEQVIHYIIDNSQTSSDLSSGQTGQQTQYTVVNISDVSAYQNEHTVIEATQEQNQQNSSRILSATQNEDGTTTLMVSTNDSEMEENATTTLMVSSNDDPEIEEIGQIDGKTVVLVRLSDTQEEQ